MQDTNTNNLNDTTTSATVISPISMTLSSEQNLSMSDQIVQEQIRTLKNEKVELENIIHRLRSDKEGLNQLITNVSECISFIY